MEEIFFPSVRRLTVLVTYMSMMLTSNSQEQSLPGEKNPVALTQTNTTSPQATHTKPEHHREPERRRGSAGNECTPKKKKKKEKQKKKGPRWVSTETRSPIGCEPTIAGGGRSEQPVRSLLLGKRSRTPWSTLHGLHNPRGNAAATPGTPQPSKRNPKNLTK